MEKKTFIIRGLAPGLDGLLVKVEGHGDVVFGCMLMVHELRNHNIVQGDRELSITLPEAALYISEKYLQPIADPGRREYDHSNPMGKLVNEGRFSRDGIEVAWAEFETIFTVTVRDIVSKRTLFSQNFSSKNGRPTVEQTLVDYERSDKDIQDLVFSLKDIENKEIEELKGLA